MSDQKIMIYIPSSIQLLLISGKIQGQPIAQIVYRISRTTQPDQLSFLPSELGIMMLEKL